VILGTKFFQYLDVLDVFYQLLDLLVLVLKNKFYLAKLAFGKLLTEKQW